MRAGGRPRQREQPVADRRALRRGGGALRRQHASSASAARASASARGRTIPMSSRAAAASPRRPARRRRRRRRTTGTGAGGTGASTGDGQRLGRAVRPDRRAVAVGAAVPGGAQRVADPRGAGGAQPVYGADRLHRPAGRRDGAERLRLGRDGARGDRRLGKLGHAPTRWRSKASTRKTWSARAPSSRCSMPSRSSSSPASTSPPRAATNMSPATRCSPPSARPRPSRSACRRRAIDVDGERGARPPQMERLGYRPRPRAAAAARPGRARRSRC